MARYRIGIDTGGTFTDLIRFDVETGEVQTLKVPSSPAKPMQAFLNAIRESGAETNEIDGLVHGTTVATNALIERSGARVAFITTAGFEDMPYIQRVNRRELYNLDWDKPRPLLSSRRDCFGLAERINAKRVVVKPLNADEVADLCDHLRQQNFEAVAVCLLFAYLNTEHEQAVKQALQEKLDGIPLSISHEVAPIWREYERASTTIADAYLKPLIRRYVGSLQSGLDDEKINIPWSLMKSNGGVMQAAAAADNPIQLAMSGPAGGLVASHAIAHLLGLKNIVTLDSGGTSADVGIIVDGELPYTTEYEIEWGIPAAIPLIDIKTVGAGGGSIAWINAGGFLQVGPQSAGADPGPICYGQGGNELTLTDANLFLGRLNPAYFLGGKMHLEKDRMMLRLQEVAEQLGMESVELAHAIIDIANENVANAIRMVSIERGHDPRNFALIAFGGAGPLHAVAIARKLGIPKVVIPPFPGNFSAFGLLMADLRVDKVWTQAFRSDQVSPQEIANQFRQITTAALAELRQQGYQGQGIVRHYIHVRYLGQNYESEIEVEPQDFERDEVAGGLSSVYKTFHQLHQAMYGYHLPKAIIELISFKVTVSGHSPTPQLGIAQVSASEPPMARSVYFAGHGAISCQVVRRTALPLNVYMNGPLIVEEPGSTTIVEPEMRLLRTQYDILLLELMMERT